MLRRAMEFIPKQIYRAYSAHKNREAYESQAYALNERTVEYRFVFQALEKLWPKSVLDVGTGMTALPQLIRNCGYEVTAIDNITDYWPRGLITSSMHNPHYHVIDDNILASKLGKTFDLGLCISTVEHIGQADQAVKEMARLTNSGGHLVITCPYTEKNYSADVYREEGTVVNRHPGYICQSFSRAQVDKWCADYGLAVAEQEYWRFWSGKFWSCGEKLASPVRSSQDGPHDLSCLLLRKK